MLVTIVAKTRMGSGACIGGITADGRSVRLIAADMSFNAHFNLDYEVGDVWEIDGEPPADILPPHTENIVVRRKRCVGRAKDLTGLIMRHMPPREGGLETLHDGLTQGQAGGPLYIAERTGVPTFSTMFWRPDRPLVRDTAGKRIRYRYPTEDGGRTLTFIGFQEPPETLPTGSIVRVSLAHWWHPVEHPEVEMRCYLQISGWFAPPETDLFQEIQRQSDELPSDEPWPEDPQPVGALEEARHLLKRVFGYDEFRPLQADIITNLLDRRDSLAVMPTGSGKSMCFQLPALIFPGLTVVVSPLISLMEDQVMQLRQVGIAAAYLNSTLPYDSYLAVTQQIKAGRVKLLYTSPETLLRPETLVMLDDCRVDCLTIDEAHCISEWGHDFRPEYRQLVQVRRRLPAAVCLAITATATERVRRDIKQTLAVGDANEYVLSFDRENLFLAVSPREDGLAQIEAFLEDHRGESGLIYCTTRAHVDELAGKLAARGRSVLPYHAGLDHTTRRANQRRFAHEEGIIIVATVAFGMGINKSNVRFVIHHDLPKDLENYYQQIGRAGRDGLPADCLLLFSRKDAMTHNFLADQGEPAQRAATAARLQAMLAYAETTGCRRRPLLGYFGEIDTAERCEKCDNCLAGERELVDLTVPAQKFLSCVARTRELFGATYIIEVLRGSRRKEILERGHDRLSTYNIGGEYSKKEWQQLARQFVSSALLLQDMDHGGLRLTPAGRAVMKGETYQGTPPMADRATHRADKRIDYDTELFEQLRRLRAELAREAEMPPYIIFSDAALRDMAIYYPQSNESFLQMQGVGVVKLERYGEAFLALIRAYCGERGIDEQAKTVPVAGSARAAPPSSPSRREEVLALYRRGHRVSEIGEMFNVKPQTVVNNLWESFRLHGETYAAEPLLAESRLAPEDRGRVLATLEALGVEKLRPVFEALGESVPYDELHLLRLYYAMRIAGQTQPDR